MAKADWTSQKSVGLRTSEMALPMNGMISDGPGIGPFFFMYFICSSKMRNVSRERTYGVVVEIMSQNVVSIFLSFCTIMNMDGQL